MDVVDVLNTPGAREALFEKFGIRKVPALVKGDEYVSGPMLDPFAKFIGLDPAQLDGLTPAQLYKKYKIVFAAGQRLIRQFPGDCILERVIPNRERAIRTLGFHIFRIGEAFLETWAGAEYSLGIADNEPPDEMRTGDDIARYGAGVWEKYEAWWAGLSAEERAMGRVLKTYYGDIDAHKMFERVTWHSAQHCRQLAAVLERMGITPDRPLTPDDLAGLPLPERLWE